MRCLIHGLYLPVCWRRWSRALFVPNKSYTPSIGSQAKIDKPMASFFLAMRSLKSGISRFTGISGAI